MFHSYSFDIYRNNLMVYHCVESRYCTVGAGVNVSSPSGSLQKGHLLQCFLFPNPLSAPLEKKISLQFSSI